MLVFYLYLIGALLLGAVCGMIFTPMILSYCKHHKLYDIPNERKMHTTATPRMGGLSFFPSMLFGFGTCLTILLLKQPSTTSLNIASVCYLAGLGFIYIVGIVDDFIGLNAPIKFVAQTIVATLLPLTGLYLNNLYGLLGIYEIPPLVGIPLTVFAIVFITNAINLIDGIDGLAACLSLLALGGFLVYFRQYNVYVNTYSIMVAAIIGGVLAFLYFNIFGKTEKNTKIFMGDGGSLFLGYMLGFLSIKSAMHNDFIWPYRQEALLVPLTLLFIPIADVIRVTLYRFFHHAPLFKADKNHIHHKLMQAGLTQHQTLAVILATAVLIVVVNLWLNANLNINLIVLIDILLYTLLNVAANFYKNKKKNPKQ